MSDERIPKKIMEYEPKMDTDPLAAAGKVDGKGRKEEVRPDPCKKKKKKNNLDLFPSSGEGGRRHLLGWALRKS
jgi:hypothetical protein